MLISLSAVMQLNLFSISVFTITVLSDHLIIKAKSFLAMPPISHWDHFENVFVFSLG